MNIFRNKQETPAVVAPQLKVGDVEQGATFRIGKKLFLKLDGDSYDGEPVAARLTTGSTRDYLTAETTIDSIVSGTFNYE